MSEKTKVIIGITIVSGGKKTDHEYHLNEEMADHFVLGGAITVDLGVEPGDVIAGVHKLETKSNHLNCKERANCGG